MSCRITKNENFYDSIIPVLRGLEHCINEFESKKDDIELINKYYGSKEWFKDKDEFEKGKIKNIKAGVLNEDAIWNMNEDIDDLISNMKSIIEWWENRKNPNE